SSVVFYVLYFFFSSRRRHTRSDRDWSSDVCSSDLFFYNGRRPLDYLPGSDLVGDVVGEYADAAHAITRRSSILLDRDAAFVEQRSEERRVGKECRSRGSA